MKDPYDQLITLSLQPSDLRVCFTQIYRFYDRQHYLAIATCCFFIHELADLQRRLRIRFR